MRWWQRGLGRGRRQPATLPPWVSLHLNPQRHPHPCSNLYGGTYNQFKVALPRLGVEVRFVEGTDPAAFEKQIDDKTRAVYIETIGNPSHVVLPVKEISEVAHKHGACGALCVAACSYHRVPCL